jgi:hypothetical protein
MMTTAHPEKLSEQHDAGGLVRSQFFIENGTSSSLPSLVVKLQD